MDRSMTCRAECDQVFFAVWATVAPKDLVVEFQIEHRAKNFDIASDRAAAPAAEAYRMTPNPAANAVRRRESRS
jgi:hypothetical protein